MVTKATHEPASAYASSSSSSMSGPLYSNAILARQFSSFPLIILLYTAATPFSPFSWALGEISGTFLFDRLLAGLVLFCAFYFQWRIASLRSSVIISIPVAGGTTIRNGRVEHATSTPLWVWRTHEYWHFAMSEAVLLVLAEWGPSESLRRVVVSVVIAALWAIGFAATPESYKRWAWTHIKAYLFVLVLDELRNIAWGGNGGGRRRRQARW
ncbi:hypothetical protein B0H66DRAFT_274439 [Apodospora peruviana]|uniref:Uncharacterized protein n=1 Tax=Apodospora peruviana TaxID=516989 RepID=A0AAE0M241_9PEZI|nr:hypothetical protein B0H66DRAFT_274439 [Apodospora peruviana]